jgi:hypothetical protein
MSVSAYLQTTNEGDYSCADMHINNSATLFPIARITNWKTKEYQRIDSTTLALVYILGALFLVPTLLSLLKVVGGVYAFLHGIKIGAMENGLNVCLFVFCLCTLYFRWNCNALVRGIYFFIMPKTIDSAVTDYILVVLPTFLLFTTFSIIIVLW